LVRERAAGDACPACRACAEAEAAAVARVAGRLEAAPDSAPAALSLLCLPHLAPLLAALEAGPCARALVAREAAMFERLAEDMRRYAIKHDALRRSLASEEELVAARYALAALVGHHQLAPAGRASP